MKTKRLFVCLICVIALIILFSIKNSAVLKCVLDIFDFGGTEVYMSQLDSEDYVYQSISGGKKVSVAVSEKENILLVTIIYPVFSTGLGYEWFFELQDFDYDFSNMSELDYKEIVGYAEKRLSLARRIIL